MNDRVRPVETIVIHERPHLDECAAIVALRRHGKQKYPGVGTAKIEFFDPAKHKDGRTEDEWLDQERCLFLGVRGGKFDDHPHEDHTDECVFTMVCDDLELTGPEWSKMRHLLLHEDRHGAGHAWHVAPLIKSVSRHVGPDEAIVATEFLLFDGYQVGQVSYLEARRIVVDKAQWIEVVNKPSGGSHWLCVVDGTDNEDISRAARTSCQVPGEDDAPRRTATMVIHRRTSGRVYVSPNSHKGVKDVTGLAVTIRHEEQLARGGEHVVTDEVRLGADGDLLYWYHHKSAAQLMNGALTATHVEPSKLQLPAIVDCCRRFLENCELQPDPSSPARSKGVAESVQVKSESRPKPVVEQREIITCTLSRGKRGDVVGRMPDALVLFQGPVAPSADYIGQDVEAEVVWRNPEKPVITARYVRRVGKKSVVVAKAPARSDQEGRIITCVVEKGMYGDRVGKTSDRRLVLFDENAATPSASQIGKTVEARVVRVLKKPGKPPLMIAQYLPRASDEDATSRKTGMKPKSRKPLRGGLD